MNPHSPRTGVSPWWRIASVVLMIALLLAWATSASMFEQLKSQISHLQSRLDQTPQVRFVSVLQDSEGQPAMLITHDPQQGVLLVQRHPTVSPWFPMLLLMYPVGETLFSIYRKLARGQSPSTQSNWKSARRRPGSSGRRRTSACNAVRASLNRPALRCRVCSTGGCGRRAIIPPARKAMS